MFDQSKTAKIWLPPTARNREFAEARKAAKDYDPNLDFGWNEKTQQYCVYLKEGTMAASKDGDWPILGFIPPDRIPTREEIQKRLYESDALRIGHEMIDAWNRHNEALMNKSTEITDSDREVAEKFEWGFRKMGSDKAPVKTFISGDKNGTSESD